MMVDFNQISLNIKKKAYPLIGTGSGRYVFDLGNGYVAKVAKNRRGLAQNKVEYRIASMDHSNIFAGILQASEDYEFLIMEKAEKVEDISEVLNYFHVDTVKELFRLEILRAIARNYHLILQDLRRPANWGKIDGRPVVVDYGFTRRVKRKYYSLF